MKLEVMKKWIGFDGTPTTSIVYWAKYDHFTNPMNEGYIGITYKGLEYRKQKHYIESKNGIKCHFKNVLRKNGNLVEWVVINSNITELMSKKIEFFFRPRVNIGWNEVYGGGKPPNQKGNTRSEEYILKQSEIKKGKKQSKETIEKRVKALTGKKRNEEFKIKQSERMIGKNVGNIKHPKHFYLEIPFIKSNTESSKKFNISIYACSDIKKGFKKGRYNWIFEEAGLSHLINN